MLERENRKEVTHHFASDVRKSREKWQHPSKCCRVIRKERSLTHRGGAWVNEHTSKRRPTPLCSRWDTVSAAASLFASNLTTFQVKRHRSVSGLVWHRKQIAFSQSPHVQASKFGNFFPLWETPPGVLAQGQEWHVTPLYGNQMWRIFFFSLETPQGILSWGGSGL